MILGKLENEKMSTTGAVKSANKNRAEMMAEIDFMLAEMKAADVRIAAHQAETDAIKAESRAIKQRSQESSLEIEVTMKKIQFEVDALLSRRSNAQ